jgi:hypothetical protein
MSREISKGTSILGIATTGNASIGATAKSTGISKINHIDEQSILVLGIFATHKVFLW